MATDKTSPKIVDFSNVKDASGFNTKPVPPGDYLAKIVKVADAESKKDGTFQFVFSIRLEKFSQNTYPYYCKLQENQLWKLRNLLIAAGMNVPKRRMKLDPSKVVGKTIGITMEDDEYDGKPKSTIASVFPASELGDDLVNDSTAEDEDDLADAAEDDMEDDLNDLELEDDTPAPKAKKAAAKPAPEVEDDDEEEEEEEEADEDTAEGDQFDDMDRAKLKRFIKGKDSDYSVKRSQSDDDLREVARGLDKPAKAAAKADDEDELEELDIDNL